MVIKKHGKPSSSRSSSGRTSKLTDRDRRALKRIVGKKHRTTAAKVTAEFNQYLSLSSQTAATKYDIYESKAYGEDMRK